MLWAGESRSEVWFDCARDITEHWHHQQQIQEATGTASLITREYYPYYPTVLSVLIRWVPVAYFKVGAPAGTAVRLTAGSDQDGEWTLARTDSGWEIDTRTSVSSQCWVDLPQRGVWLLFTKKLTPETVEAARRSSVIRSCRDPFGSNAIMG